MTRDKSAKYTERFFNCELLHLYSISSSGTSSMDLTIIEIVIFKCAYNFSHRHISEKNASGSLCYKLKQISTNSCTPAADLSD